MALLGTLADFHVDDILVLLASTKKTGVLVVEGKGRSGRVWMDSGHVVAGQSGPDHEPGVVVFDLLRLDQGRFSFDDGVAPPKLGAPLEVPAVLAEAKAKLAEWRDIEAVVPTMNSLVALDAAGGGGDDITIAADQWRTVAAVGAGGTVAEVGARLSAGEFAACKAVKALVDAGLATVTVRPLDAAVAAPRASTARAGAAATGPGETTPAAEPKQEDPQTTSRSELVRQLSELRGS